MMEPVRTSQIYWGAVPFVIIQVAMIGVVIGFPGIVMRYKGPVVDTSHVIFSAPASGLGGGLGGLGDLGAGLGGKPADPLGGGLLATPPNFGVKPVVPAP